MRGQMPSIRVKIHFEDGKMWATVDDMPGVFATGDTYDELRESLGEAISLYRAGPGEAPSPVSVGVLEPVETSMQAALA